MSFLNYAPAMESTDSLTLAERYGQFLDGDFVAGTGRPTPTISPATEEPITTVVAGTPADVDTAVSAARAAFDATWSTTPGEVRASYLFRIAGLVQERGRELAVAESLNSGRPIRASRADDIPLAAASFFYHAGWADKLEYAGLGEQPRPLGVVGHVLPWTSPLLALAMRLAPALAAGNTVVVNPAETTPLTALLFAEILQQAELPPGVVNIVTGGQDVRESLAAHPGLDMVSFTGPSSEGRTVARAAAGTHKRLALELGGTTATIVFDDAPLDEAIEGIVAGAFATPGHVASGGARLLVQENVHDDVIERLRHRMTTLRLGDPLDHNTDIGPVHSAAQLAHLTQLCRSGEAQGATRWSPPGELPQRGFWFPPTLLTGATPSHGIARAEACVPVLGALTFRTPAEAIALANNSRHGAAAAVWTSKGSRAAAVARQLRAGVVWINTVDKVDPAAPFGGYKESGYGRQGGRHGLLTYLQSATAGSPR